jgi:hypothetical protein
MLFAIGRSKPSAVATLWRSTAKPVPASAAAPSGDSLSRARVGETSAVAAGHLDIGEKMVAERHRLRDLKVGEAGHDAAGMFVGAREQRGLQRLQSAVDALARGADPEAEVGRDLVVARTRGVEAPGGLADDVLEPRFHRHVDILEREVYGHAVARELFGDLREAGVDRRGVGGGDNALRAEHRRVRAARGDILFPQALVDGDRRVYLLHDRGGTATEAATPHAALVRRFRHSPRPKPENCHPRPVAGGVDRRLR